MPNISSYRRSRLLGFALALALAGLALGLSIGQAGASNAAGSTLMVTYTSSKSIQVKLADGTVVGSGTPVPAGSYTVLVYDDPNTYPNPRFTINGPGVAVSSDLNSTGMGLDEPASLGPYTFQTSSTYTVEDTNMGASSLVTFTTTATSGGSSSTVTSTASSSTVATTTTMMTTTTTATTTTTPSVAKTLGTLKGSVSAAGKAALSFDGKAPKRVKAGRYKVTVVDHSRKAGLFLGEASKHTLTLSGLAALGTSTHTVSLSAGKWFFEASSSGPKSSFTVVK